jgi:hypothetical protein
MSNAWTDGPLFPYIQDFRRLNKRNKNQFVIADAPAPDAWQDVFLAGIAGRRNSLPGSMYPPYLRELHPQGFIIFSFEGKPFQTCDFDIQTETINGTRRFVFFKNEVDLEWRRHVATRRIFCNMSALEISEWNALVELAAKEAGLSQVPWFRTVETASRAVRQYLRAVSVIQVEQIADTGSAGGGAAVRAVSRIA